MMSSSPHYVALGDSLVEGYTDWGVSDAAIGYAYVLGATLRAVRPEYRFTNLGVSGARTADVLRDQVAPAIALRPSLVTLTVGANDVRATDPDQFRHTFDRLVGEITGNTDGLVLVSNIPNFAHLLPQPFAAYRVMLEGQLQLFNQAVHEVVMEHGATLVDLYGTHEAEDPRNIGADGFHPSARGYRVMARSFVQRLQERGWELPPVAVD
jgi:lysophospholipase L1-like esterase